MRSFSAVRKNVESIFPSLLGQLVVYDNNYHLHALASVFHSALYTLERYTVLVKFKGEFNFIK